MKSIDTSFIARETINAYLEMVLGVMVLRIPSIQNLLISDVPKAVIGSSYPHEKLIIETADLLNGFKKEGFKDIKSLQSSFRHVNRIFLLAMWDILYGHKNYDKICNEPEIQFFRHIRNGCAHYNQIYFDKNPENINKIAKWRNKEITFSDEGKKVFPDILKDGDPIFLVIDINNKYFVPIDFTK